MQLDPTGKISLDHIYTQPDPRAYFSTLRSLGYAIPALARPCFAALIDEYRRIRQVPIPRVLDVGCSYGINAALLRSAATMDELYERYAGPEAAACSRAELLRRDRELLRSWQGREHGRGGEAGARFVGLDVSEPALAYALAAGFLDEAVHADLESGEPTGRQRDLLAGTDLVVSTGCMGYVTEKTISRIVDAQGGRLPWMAHFVLRMFPFDPVADTLVAAGYETHRVDRLFRQRRFATAEEQSLVLGNLSALGIDPAGLEADGWFYAQLHLSLPRETPVRAIIDVTTAAALSIEPEDGHDQ